MKKIAANDIPISLAGFLALHVRREEQALGIKASRRTLDLVNLYSRERGLISLVLLEATMLRGQLKVKRAQVAKLLDEALHGKSDMKLLKKAQQWEREMKLAVERLEALEQMMQTGEWRNGS